MTSPPGDGATTDAFPFDQQLLLRAALHRGKTAAAAWREWREGVVIDDVDGSSQRLLALMARRLDDVSPDDPLRALVRGIYRHAWVRNQLLIRDAAHVVEAMRRQGVPTVVLKGAALVPFYGGDWGARPMYDVDVLVPARRADDALSVLDELGWVPAAGLTYDWVRWRAVPRHHGWGFERDDGQLDLHWHVFATALGPRVDDALWAAAVPLDVGPLHARALSTPDLLLHVLVHGAMTAEPQWVVDAVFVLRAAPADLASRFVAQARAYHEVGTVRTALATIVELLDDPAAARLLREVDRVRPSRVERVTRGRSGHAADAVRQFARFGGGRAPVTALSALARDRLDLDLARRRVATVVYALSGRAPLVARVMRRFGGPLARTPAQPLPDERAPVDFFDAPSVDRHAGPGWWMVSPDGATTIGTESRAMIPSGIAPDGGDRIAPVLTLEVATSPGTGAARIDVLVNDSRVAGLDVTETSSTHRIAVPAVVARRYEPAEVAIRGASHGLIPRATRTRLVVRRIELEVGPG